MLPFENLGSPEDDYFADGIADGRAGQAHFHSGRGGDRKKQLHPLQEDDEDAEGNRKGAGRRRYLLTATSSLAEERRSEAGSSQSRARRGQGVRRSRLQVAEAIRRGADGRFPGAVGDRLASGAGVGRGARYWRGEAAFREAHAEPRCLRCLPEGRRGLQRRGGRPSEPAAGARLLRAGGRARPRLRAGLGHRARQCVSVPVVVRRPTSRNAPGKRRKRLSRWRRTGPRATSRSAATGHSSSATSTGRWSGTPRRSASRPATRTPSLR